jgi:diguanylate cyclase (GGDEF)-like protein/PAS domain S-box-containing protein
MHNREKFDKISVLLSLFMLLLISLFYYLYNVEKSIQNYSKDHENVITLELLEKEFNDFSVTMNKFTNYDKVNNALNTFQKILEILEKDLYLDYPNNHAMHQQFKKIQNYFHKEREDIEYFKSLNASLISGSHFLFDLQTTISEDQAIASREKNLINESLFYLLRFTTSDYIDKSYVLKKLSKLRKFSQNDKNEFIHNFYIQSIVILETVASLKQIALDIHDSQLHISILKLNHILDNNYEKDFFIQKIIALLFFISTIIILFVLIKTHIQTLKNEKELYAFKYAVEHSDNTIVLTDPDRKITFVNDVFEKTTGYTKQEALGKNPNILKSNQQDEAFYQNLNLKLSKKKKWEGEFINKRKDGSLFYEKASIVPVFLNKKLISYLAIKLDITEYIEQNMKLAQAASVFENTEEAIIIADADGKVTSVNTAFTAIYNYTTEDIKGKNLSILHSNIQDTNFYKNMWQQIMEKGLWRGKIINKTKNGEIIPVWSTIKKISDKHGNTVNYTAIQTDLRELESSQAKADYLAYHDPLTGLYNRINFEEYLAHALFNAKRNASMLAILFIDLDRFKVINDTLGHDLGDEVLIIVAQRLKTALRKSDFISRWGGDEFVVILENLTSPSEAAVVATNIIDILKEPMDIKSHHLITTASIGISLYPENAEDSNTLIKYADSAMYLAKDMGKNNFRYYTTELSKEIQIKLDIDMALHNALEKKEIFMVFQPQYKLQNKTIISVEALVRWENSELGFVPPDKFIPIAEDSGTIIPLGYFIFEESCKAYKQMKDQGLFLKQIAINVSSIQFKEPHLLETFVSIAKRHNIEPSEIEIEITERFIMEHTITNINMLQNFRNYGFKISIDDFGTGYSSMSYLKQLPIDTIKIDKSFIDDIADDSPDNVIVEAIIALSKTLGYQIVAEGIETQNQEDFLTKVNCDIGQGYLFSRPISCDTLIEKYSS